MHPGPFSSVCFHSPLPSHVFVVLAGTSGGTSRQWIEERRRVFIVLVVIRLCKTPGVGRRGAGTGPEGGCTGQQDRHGGEGLRQHGGRGDSGAGHCDLRFSWLLLLLWSLPGARHDDFGTDGNWIPANLGRHWSRTAICTDPLFGIRNGSCRQDRLWSIRRKLSHRRVCCVPLSIWIQTETFHAQVASPARLARLALVFLWRSAGTLLWRCDPISTCSLRRGREFRRRTGFQWFLCHAFTARSPHSHWATERTTVSVNSTPLSPHNSQASRC